MTLYLVSLCKEDGSTPLGQCSEHTIEAKDHYELMQKVSEQYKGWEVVSWGNKEHIDRASFSFWE